MRGNYNGGAYALGCAPKELRNDRKIVLAAVKQNGFVQEYASPELRKDREIVPAVVTQKGLALKYASEELKNDRSIVLAAVKENVRDRSSETLVWRTVAALGRTCGW